MWIIAVLGVLVVAALWLNYWRFSEHRRAEEDSGDTRPSTSPRVGTGTISASAISTYGAMYPTHFAVGGTIPTGAPSPSLTVVQQDEPIKAYKAAWAKLDEDGKVTIRGTNYDIEYGVEAVAQCGHGMPPVHHHFDPDHSCGFYAVRTLEDIKPYLDELRQRDLFTAEGFHPSLLDVELYGMVVEGTIGYRAEKMRVLKVQAYNSIMYCNWYSQTEKDGVTRVTRPIACTKVATRMFKVNSFAVNGIQHFYYCDEHLVATLLDQSTKPSETTNAETDWEWK